jgi:glyoxylase-like metal-dependent hydrolase (beta-lactamase superfamily II)
VRPVPPVHPSLDPGFASPSSDGAPAGDKYQWLEEGAHEVAAGVHRIPLPLPFDGLRAVNAYAIEAADGLVMIDSGWLLEATQNQLERSLAKIGAGFGDISRFLVTHIHRDHYTQAIGLRRIYGMKVALGAEEKHSLDLVLGKDPHAVSPQAARLVRAGADQLMKQMAQAGMRPPAREAGYEEPDEWIASGHVYDLGLRRLEAIATPGHTRGHVVFADAEAGLLFAGDHVLPHITPSISLEAAPQELPLHDFIESLLLVRRMPDLALLPAHGPVSPSVHARVDELLDHHDARLRAMLAVLSDGARTAYQVAGAIRWTSRSKQLAELDLMNQMLAVGETLSHLDLLVARRLAAADNDGEVQLFRPAEQSRRAVDHAAPA